MRRHIAAVWRYLRMHGAGPEEADDLTQETFVTAFARNAEQFDPAAAAVFLRRTARFTFLHHLRRRARDPELADAVDELWDRDAAHDGGDGLLEQLRACVQALDGRAREAVERAYGIGRPGPDDRDRLARELGLKSNGLKTLLQRTRRLLRACLERKQP